MQRQLLWNTFRVLCVKVLVETHPGKSLLVLVPVKWAERFEKILADDMEISEVMTFMEDSLSLDGNCRYVFEDPDFTVRDLSAALSRASMAHQIRGSSAIG